MMIKVINIFWSIDLFFDLTALWCWLTWHFARYLSSHLTFISSRRILFSCQITIRPQLSPSDFVQKFFCKLGKLQTGKCCGLVEREDRDRERQIKLCSGSHLADNASNQSFPEFVLQAKDKLGQGAWFWGHWLHGSLDISYLIFHCQAAISNSACCKW